MTSTPVCGCCPRAFHAMVELDVDCAFESDESAERLMFPFGGEISMFIPLTATVLFVSLLGVVLEMNLKCNYIQHPPPHARDVFLSSVLLRKTD